LIRVLLNDAQWARIAPLLPGKEGDPLRSGEDNRRFMEAVLWIVRAGAPWRDLPKAFGKWSSVWKRFRRWAIKGVFERIFAALSEDPDFECALVDGTIVKVHRHGASAKGDSKSGHRQVARRADDQDRRSRRCVGQFVALRPAAGPTAR
jgi:transposase